MTSSRPPSSDRQALNEPIPYDPTAPASSSCSDAQLRERVLYLRSLAPTAFQELAFFAFVREDFKEAQCVLAAGADPEMTWTSLQSTPLMLAAQNGRVDIIELLLPLANPNRVDIDSETALFYAIRNYQSSAIEALVGAVNPDVANINGDTALMLALESQISSERIRALARICHMPKTNINGDTCERLERRYYGEAFRDVRDIFAQRRALIERDQLLSGASAHSPRVSSPRM